MHSTILTPQEATKISQNLKSDGKKIGVAGGCFDILHVGHLHYLQKAREKVDVLFVLLESDCHIQKIKGANRPINTQSNRAQLLAALRFVDYVVLLPQICTNAHYDAIIVGLNPVLIAITHGDPGKVHKERQATLTGAKVEEVTKHISDQSTSKIARLLSQDL